MSEEKKRPYWLDEDDDGRTIVDMSGVRRRNLLFPQRVEDEVVSAPETEEKEPETKEREKNRVVEENGQIMDEAEANGYRPWEERGMSRQETRSFILGATAAGLLLVGIFIAAGGLLIKLMLWAWT